MNSWLATIDDCDRALLQRADAFCRDRSPNGMTRGDLRRCNREHGTDFATAVLYSHFMSAVRTPWLAPETDLGETASAIATPRIAIAPGAFYKEYPHIGADASGLAAVAKERNWECELIPTDSLGTLDENAATIVQWLESREALDVVLVSLSKGAADVKIALQERPDLWPRIRAWFCVSGILYGTKMADWLLDRKRLWLTTKLVLWYRNRGRDSLDELRHDVGTDAGCRLAVPCARPNRWDDRGDRAQDDRDADDRDADDPIHIVGFPLAKHLSCWRSRLWHRRFQEDGPNDGVILLEGLLDQPGTVLPIWGADHYLNSSFDTSIMLADLIEWVAAQTRDCQRVPSEDPV